MSAPHGITEIKAVYGDPYPHVLHKHSWENHVLKTIPIGDGITLKNAYDLSDVTNITGHVSAVDLIAQCLRDCVTAGVPTNRLTYGGAYWWRYKRTDPTKLSLHTWGVAIEIDPMNNPWGKSWVDDGIMLHPTIVSTFLNAGFRWGNGFPIADPMHFQLASGY